MTMNGGIQKIGVSLFICIFLLILHSSLFAAQLLTLRDAIMLSLRYNPSVKNAEIQRVADKFSLLAAQYAYELQYQFISNYTYNNIVNNGVRSENDNLVVSPQASLLLPIGTQLSMTMNNTLNHTGGSSAYYNPSISFSITQPLLRGFGSEITLTPLYNARDQEIVNELTLKNALISTLTTVIDEYTAVIQAQNSVIAQQQQLIGAQQTLKNTLAFVKNGRNAPADLIQFETNVATQELALQQQKLNFQQTLLTLLNTLGLDPTTQVTFPTTVDFPFQPELTLQQAIDIALANNIAYQQALLALKVLQRNYYVAKDAQRWQLNASLTQTFGPGSGGTPNSGLASLTNGRNQTTTAALSLNVPIDNVPLQQTEVNAKVALDIQQTSLTFAKINLENQVINAYNTLLIQKKLIVQAAQDVKLSQKTLNIAQSKMRYGRVTAFEVSTLQSNLVVAQLTYINTLAQYDVTQANLDQLIGKTLDRWKIEVKY